MAWEISTDRSTWTTFAAAGITGATLRFVACGTDTCTLTVSGDYLASPLAALGATLYIRQGATQRFIGRVTSNPRRATGQSERYDIELSGGWWWLERTPALQRWGDGSEAGIFHASIVVGQTGTGAAVPLSSTINEIISNAISMRSVPITIGAIDTMGTLPSFSLANQRVSDVILACLRWQPDYIIAWDYTGEEPAISLLRPASATPVQIDLDAKPPTNIDIAPMHGDVVPGVRVVYEIQSVTDGVAFNDYATATAGSYTDPLAVEVLFPLRGPSSNTQVQTQTQSIVCEAVSPSSKTFWKGIFFGTLGSVADGDWSIVDTDGPSVYKPYRLTQGVITGWMRTHPTTPVSAARESWVLTVAIHTRDGDGSIVRTETRRLAARWVGCNSPSATFTLQSSSVSYTSGEDIPSGVASMLLASWSRLHYEGTITWQSADCDFALQVGDILRLTNGLAAWATMDAQVRDVQHSIADGTTSVSFGAPTRLEPAAALGISRASRGYSLNGVPRSEEATPPVESVSGPELSAELTLSEGEPGLPSRILIEDGDAEKIIDLDTAAITGDDSAVPETFVATLKPRIIWEAVPTFDETSGHLTKITFQQREGIVSDVQGDPIDVNVIDCAEEGGGGGLG